MAKKVFFSFKYEDVARAMVVRNSSVTQDSAGFIDKADFEAVKKQGNEAIKNWIDNQLKGTTVTVVLVGENTNQSKWVKYEIEESIKRGNGLLEINISKINALGHGTSDFCGWMLPNEYKAYNWNKDNGYNNLSAWIDMAAEFVGK
ncbi:TIR domain-containing protein [Acinetobacter nematophilus]|uniref:TIR domain-containing protein n=1 Tax=Acinetobacter nematophilus TaxID=2994642 RepID=A0A9X3DT95_9GAMM|nr:TIR domain-containing protein [Acinetobacter nematophilus]